MVFAAPASAAPACSDGVDNDGDNLVDFPADPGCVDAADFHEEPANHPTGAFSCRASAARVAGLPGLPTIEPFVANEPVVPCAADDGSLIGRTAIGPVGVAALFAFTEPGRRGGWEAHAGVTAAAILLGPGIGAQVVNSSAYVKCVAGAPVLSSSSKVTNLVIGGVPVLNLPPGHAHIVVPDVGTLHLNETISGPGSVTRRALWLETPSALLPEVVVAESHADFTGDPCP
jgi:hypothetical protein